MLGVVDVVDGGRRRLPTCKFVPDITPNGAFGQVVAWWSALAAIHEDKKYATEVRTSDGFRTRHALNPCALPLAVEQTRTKPV